MKTTVKLMLLFLWLSVTIMNVGSQTTIGSTIEPLKGALLDLKDHVADANNTTATNGGLVLSRVRLVDKTTLQPFIKTGDPEWNIGNQKKTRIEHIGLLVYNLTNDAFFHAGMYLWQGDEWKSLALGKNLIQLPAFNLEWKANAKVDLYNVYKMNFKPDVMSHYISNQGNNTPVDFPDFETNPENFYYVVAKYDSVAFTIHSISPQGEMTYSKAGNSPAIPKDAFINVYVIRK